MDQPIGISGKDIIIVGILGGGTIQTARWIAAEERYKHIGQFIWDYPGVFISGVASVAGLAVVFKSTFINLFGVFRR